PLPTAHSFGPLPNGAGAADPNMMCAIGSCNAPFKDCDGTVANGCEVNTSNDVNNCNGCNLKCVVANGTASCSGSACRVASCNAPFKDCDAVYGNGCESNTSNDINNCNTCGNKCINNMTCINSMCSAGVTYTGVYTQGATPVQQCTDWKHWRAVVTRHQPT